MRMHLYISTVHSIDVCTYTVRKKKEKVKQINTPHTMVLKKTIFVLTQFLCNERTSEDTMHKLAYLRFSRNIE